MPKMKMLTQEILDRLPPYKADMNPEAVAQVKFFAPWLSWKWYATEYNPETRTFYGVVKGDETEWGPWTLDELESVTGPLNLKIERDKFFKPTKIKDLFPEGV